MKTSRTHGRSSCDRRWLPSLAVAGALGGLACSDDRPTPSRGSLSADDAGSGGALGGGGVSSAAGGVSTAAGGGTSGGTLGAGGSASTGGAVEDGGAPEGGRDAASTTDGGDAQPCPGGDGFTAQPRLTGDTPAFGGRVALSGSSALVGVWGESIEGRQDEGAAYVFVRQNASWTRQAKLLAPDGQERWHFGTSVSLDADTAVVGARMDPLGARGAAYVFVRTGSAWAWQATLQADDGYDGQSLGYSVAIDGDTAIVGLPTSSSNRRPGAAYVFARSGTQWTQQAKLVPPDSADEDWFGSSVSVSGDTALVGAWALGGAYAFERNGTAWTFLAKLEVEPVDDYGLEVALSGTTAVVGSSQETVDGSARQGAVYVFERAGNTWSRSKLSACDAASGSYFGTWVSVSGDRLAATSRRYSSDTGAVHLFERSGASWVQRALLSQPASSGFSDFGALPVSLSGGTLLVANSPGVHVFTAPPSP